ncbi:MAG: sigma-54-dependent transcriptional regulator, partial [Flavisolibacter sp.]
MPATILLIDDEEGLRKLLARIIGLEGFKVEEAGTLKAAFDVLKRIDIDVILCDVKLPDGNGVNFVKEAKSKHPLVEIILLTAYGNIPDGVQAIKNGAFDYITKGNDNDRVIPLINQAMEKVLTQKKAAIKIKDKGAYTFDAIIGDSQVIQQAIALAKRIAPTDTNVLLLGETGTGKEIFANAIHSHSKRSSNSFIAINCSAFTKELLEGELFGHKAGAYTGASKDKPGLIELADKGTLFLDEIGEMNIDLQAKLLRVIENGEFIKLGDAKTTKVDVRIIAATNRDLEKSIAHGEFREDLYYRLNVFPLFIPPLRERRADIPLLVNHFIEKNNKIHGLEIKRISSTAIDLLMTYHWPGNIRELENCIERASILSTDKVIRSHNLPPTLQSAASTHSRVDGGLEAILENVEKQMLIDALNMSKGNITKAAEQL